MRAPGQGALVSFVPSAPVESALKTGEMTIENKLGAYSRHTIQLMISLLRGSSWWPAGYLYQPAKIPMLYPPEVPRRAARSAWACTPSRVDEQILGAQSILCADITSQIRSRKPTQLMKGAQYLCHIFQASRQRYKVNTNISSMAE